MRRALLSAKHFREGYCQNEANTRPNIHLFKKSHEFKGCNEKGKTFPGLNKKEIL